MKWCWGFILSLYLIGHPLSAQFTYLDQLSGPLSEVMGDTFTNVELIGDTIYTYGAYADTVAPYLQLQRYDLEGLLIDSVLFDMSANDNTYIETTASYVQALNSQHLFFSYAKHDSLGTRGVVGKVGLDLDTLWVNEYDHYHPYTYFLRNLDVGDGVVLVGEIESDGSQRGTMLSKIDYEGELIWDTVLRPANGDINRNGSLIKKDSLLVLGGAVFSDGERLGLITKTDLQGGILWEHFYDDSGQIIGPFSGGYEVSILTSDEMVSAIYIDYSPAGGAPSNWYGKVVVNKVDLENEVLFWEHEYLTDFESLNGGINKVLPTSDGGMAILGGDYNAEQIGWILKIDSLGELEWQKYYAYETGYQHFNQVYDFEICPDGGYLIVGSYSDWNTGSSLPRSWMVKTDPCGDVEWNGCLPVGLGEMEMRPRVEVSIYPNPASDQVAIVGLEDHEDIDIGVYDVIGRKVVRSLDHSSTLDVRALPSGIYQVVAMHDGQVIGTARLEVHH